MFIADTANTTDARAARPRRHKEERGTLDTTSGSPVSICTTTVVAHVRKQITLEFAELQSVDHSTTQYVESDMQSLGQHRKTHRYN